MSYLDELKAELKNQSPSRRRKASVSCPNGHDVSSRILVGKKKHTACSDCYHERHIKRSYGISVEAYNALLDQQGHRCAICAVAWEPSGRRLSLDHDHVTGAIRGFLCSSCNSALGHLKDDPSLAMKAAAYLMSHKR